MSENQTTELEARILDILQAHKDNYLREDELQKALQAAGQNVTLPVLQLWTSKLEARGLLTHTDILTPITDASGRTQATPMRHYKTTPTASAGSL